MTLKEMFKVMLADSGLEDALAVIFGALSIGLLYVVLYAVL